MDITQENCCEFFNSVAWFKYRVKFVDAYANACSTSNVVPEQCTDLDKLCYFAQVFWEQLPDIWEIHDNGGAFNIICDMAEYYCVGQEYDDDL